jgi:hypothetical protein
MFSEVVYRPDLLLSPVLLLLKAEGIEIELLPPYETEDEHDHLVEFAIPYVIKDSNAQGVGFIAMSEIAPITDIGPIEEQLLPSEHPDSQDKAFLYVADGAQAAAYSADMRKRPGKPIKLSSWTQIGSSPPGAFGGPFATAINSALLENLSSS